MDSPKDPTLTGRAGDPPNGRGSWIRYLGIEPKAINYAYLVFGVVALLGAVYCIFRPSTTLALTALAALPFVYTLRESMRELEKVIWAIVSLALILGVARGLSREQRAHDAAQKHIAEQFDQTKKGIEHAIDQGQLQFTQTMSQFSKTTDELGNITKLARSSLNAATGGNSFCYTLPLSTVYSDGGGGLIFIQEGKFPLSDVVARVVDLDIFEAMLKSISRPAMDSLMAGSTNIRIGHMAVHSSFGPYNWPPAGHIKRFNVFFSAKNGFWSEALRIRLVHGAWVSALKVETSVAGKKPKVLIEKVDAGFPRNSKGHIDW